MGIEIARSDAQIAACFDVMSELRPALERGDFVARVRRQEREGFTLAYLTDVDSIVAVAGFRVFECLADGRVLYVDDLVTRSSSRSLGFGKHILDWLAERARAERCGKLRLDSAVHRFAAHRFYLRERMEIRSHHFILDLDESRSRSSGAVA